MIWKPANILNGLALSGVGAIAAVSLINQAPPGIDPITTASIAATPVPAAMANRFMVIDHAANRTCIFALHRAEGYDVHRVDPASNCDAVSQRLADARAWQEMPNGKITITDRAGTPILRLGPSDGLAYDVIEPGHLAMSLEAF